MTKSITCTEDHPYTGAKHNLPEGIEQVVHPDACEVGEQENGYPGGDIVTMKCPHCGHQEDKVVDSRPYQDGRAIRRRRECIECGERFTTFEYVEQGTLTVTKSDDRREPFDRNKILQGLKLACNKRPVTSNEMQAIVERIETELNARGTAEVPSKDIGELVMTTLREVDEIAYVRFVSVYRNFKDKKEFFEEMKKLLE
jgi:transcriptional repressor NrdR